MNVLSKLTVAVVVLLAFGAAPGAVKADIRNTKHNFSITGKGRIRALGETEICIFCHTPKKARKNIPFLWNRVQRPTQYKPYQSSTLDATVGQPTGSSRICLSCHDGTIALGAVFSRRGEIQFKGGIRFIPPDLPARLGTDLSNDHPVSFIYDEGVVSEKGKIVAPSLLPSQVKLDADGAVQCTSCHDPHDDAFGKFLVMPNARSALCTACHFEEGWSLSSHALSTARWNGQRENPWPDSSYDTVADNGCENCHRPHSADRPQRLLKQVFEEDTCLVCHNGTVAAKNIENAIVKPYRHAVQDYYGVHDSAENFDTGRVRKHVECEDCHNSHQANAIGTPNPPAVSGVNLGVTGISLGGQQIPRAGDLYEICFKCHAENNVISVLPATRQIAQLNTRAEFSPGNPSFHPVTTIGVNREVPSLLAPYTTASIIYCTDCHNSEDPSGARGPHGSIYEHLLAKNYETRDFTDENPNSYALCYSCHSRNSLLSEQSFKHRKHVVEQKTPCAVCHDPHGINNLQGNFENNSHLINFDITVAKPESAGNLYFQDLGRFTGQCFLTCHGKEHVGAQYP